MGVENRLDKVNSRLDTAEEKTGEPEYIAIKLSKMKQKVFKWTLHP